MAVNPEAVRKSLKLYLVTDPVRCAPIGVVETVQRAVKGGVTCVQLRDKSASTARLMALGRAVKSALEGTGVPLIVNDDLDAAIACGADGVHLGQSDADARLARDIVGPDKIIGVTCETAAHVRAIDASRIDYLGIGTVFSTQTKPDHSDPIGMAGLAALCALSPLPTVAIGGLKPHHRHAVFEAGADGLAIVSAICGQRDPQAAARSFFEN
ncbi:MAG: thiamine phosphate synthase [Pseudomonadota bacterium]